eukprot:CAMPEP_0172706182 /NCGR_PEP_ID=MMETSP1074-20121228/45845_1 /TAXON_ID=2916 /ORGANISM="Ceratium fusus, Strain PA161109" /LENGTH=54 /DNA_ID=CAMNT_0013528717 /DNA_START=75 /DNA_END=236 /DNA_ORIENTATION=-
MSSRWSSAEGGFTSEVPCAAYAAAIDSGMPGKVLVWVSLVGVGLAPLPEPSGSK